MSQIDIFATLAAIVGFPIPAGSAEDSIDQRAMLTATGPSARDTLIHNTNPKAYAIRHGDWVMIDAETGGVSRVPEWFDHANGYAKNTQAGELYDLRQDLAQKHNRYADEPARVADLKKRLQSIVGEQLEKKGDSHQKQVH